MTILIPILIFQRAHTSTEDNCKLQVLAAASALVEMFLAQTVIFDNFFPRFYKTTHQNYENMRGFLDIPFLGLGFMHVTVKKSNLEPKRF